MAISPKGHFAKELWPGIKKHFEDAYDMKDIPIQDRLAKAILSGDSVTATKLLDEIVANYKQRTETEVSTEETFKRFKKFEKEMKDREKVYEKYKREIMAYKKLKTDTIRKESI